MENFDKSEISKKEEATIKKPDQPLILSSKKTWFWVAIVIAILDPVFAGLILGVFFLTEKELKKEGKIVLGLAIVFGFIFFYITQKLLPWLSQQGLL